MKIKYTTRLLRRKTHTHTLEPVTTMHNVYFSLQMTILRSHKQISKNAHLLFRHHSDPLNIPFKLSQLSLIQNSYSCPNAGKNIGGRNKLKALEWHM